MQESYGDLSDEDASDRAGRGERGSGDRSSGGGGGGEGVVSGGGRDGVLIEAEAEAVGAAQDTEDFLNSLLS